MLFAGKLPVSTRTLLVFAALALAAVAHYAGFDTAISEGARSIEPFGAFFVGMFYTLGITTPTAFIILIDMMLENDAAYAALAASLAAAAADTALFTLMRKELEKGAGRLMDALHARLGGHSAMFPLIGLLMFGSPFPDEFALAFMQISEIKPARIFVVVFIAKLIALVSVYAAVAALQ